MKISFSKNSVSRNVLRHFHTPLWDMLGFCIQVFRREQREVKHTAVKYRLKLAKTRQKFEDFSEIPNQNLNIV